MKISARSKQTMKTHNYSTRSAILLLIVSLFVSAFVTGQAMGAEPRSPHAAATSQAPARLIIRRNPNLGADIIVRLWIDGQPARAIGYGHTYEGFLAPFHLTLAVLPSPSPLWPVPWQ